MDNDKDTSRWRSGPYTNLAGDSHKSLTSAQACAPFTHRAMYTHKFWPPNSHVHSYTHIYTHTENKQKWQNYETP